MRTVTKKDVAKRTAVELNVNSNDSIKIYTAENGRLNEKSPRKAGALHLEKLVFSSFCAGLQDQHPWLRFAEGCHPCA